MRDRALSLAIAAAVALGLVVPPAMADGPEASRPPRTSGPLVGLPLECEDHGPARSGGVAGQSCSWTYRLVPAETDVDEDYSAYWVQMEIDPGNGWCVRRLHFEYSTGSGERIVSAVPATGSPTRHHGGVAITELVADAQGAAPEPATVAQDVTSAPGKTDVRMNAGHYEYTWRGRLRRKLVVAIGLQLATSPPMISGGSEGLAFGGGPCRGGRSPSR